MNKHVRNGCLSGTKPNIGDSHFGSSMKIKYIFYQHWKKIVGNGKNARFLGRLLVDYKPLKISYARLYNLSIDHYIVEVMPCKKIGRFLDLEELCGVIF